MDTAIQRRWVAALRAQPNAAAKAPIVYGLRRGDLLSPTGVLCQLHADAHGTDWEANRHSAMMSYAGHLGPSLPAIVQAWADVPAAPAIVGIGYVQGLAVTGTPLGVIADLIEARGIE